MPANLQQELVNTIKGLEHAVIEKPGYGVEYDYVDPRLEDKKVIFLIRFTLL